MISFSAPTADINGSRTFREDAENTSLTPPQTRASRTKCLNATVHIQHSGVVDGDRTFSIVVKNATEAEYEFMKYLQNNYTSALVSCREGVFSGLIESVRIPKGNLNITFWVNERLDA